MSRASRLHCSYNEGELAARTILSFGRLDAWVSSVVKWFAERKARDKRPQNWYLNMFEGNRKIVAQQIVGKIVFFSEL